MHDSGIMYRIDPSQAMARGNYATRTLEGTQGRVETKVQEQLILLRFPKGVPRQLGIYLTWHTSMESAH